MKIDNIPFVSEKDKSKRGFGSFDALSVMASCLLVIGITISILRKNNEQRNVQLAKNSAKSFAEELVLGPVNSSKNKSRIPASNSEKDFYEGKLGNDPWGQPYSYKVIQNSYGQPVYLIVISGGPNHSLDTNLEQSSYETRKTAQIDIKGDDVGYLKSFR